MVEEMSRWSMVAEFTNHPEADLAKNLLEICGISGYIWSDDCGGLAVGQTFIQRVRLFVPNSDQEAAMDILGKSIADAWGPDASIRFCYVGPVVMFKVSLAAQ